jgi:hypothetical protein
MQRRRAQLVQRRAGQAPAERGIDRRNAEWARPRLLGQGFGGGDRAPQARQVLLHRLDREHGGTICSWFVLLIPSRQAGVNTFRFLS